MTSRSNFKLRFLVAFVAAATLARADIINGGFETGDFTGWTVGGTSANGQVLTAADLPGSGLIPPEGDYFALLSTGPGADGIEGTTTLTSIPYLVGENAEVGFQLDFLSSQPTADVPNDDFWQFNVLGIVDTTAESGDVFTDMANGSLQLIVPGSYVAAPDGTALTYHTGFNELFVDLSAYEGTEVQFQFLVSPALAAQENFADSALLIDDVSSPDLIPTPEPSETAPIAIISAAFAVFYFRRRARSRTA